MHHTNPITHEIRLLTGLIHKIPRQMMEQRFSEQGLDLSMLQYGILRMIAVQPYTLTELSGHMGLDPSTLVPSIKQLEKRGYVERKRDPEDRRRYPLYLTDEGNTLNGQLCNQEGHDPLSDALDALGEDDLALLRDLLQRVVFNLPDGEAIYTEVRAQMLEMHARYLQESDDPD